MCVDVPFCVRQLGYEVGYRRSLNLHSLILNIFYFSIRYNSSKM
jgi:hypothetical protein